MTTGIERLRSVVRWADTQVEDIWDPPNGQPATPDQVLALHTLCIVWGVDDPRDLDDIDEPRAAKAWRRWRCDRDAVAFFDVVACQEEFIDVVAAVTFSDVDDFRADVSALAGKAEDLLHSEHRLPEDFRDALDDLVNQANEYFAEAEDLDSFGNPPRSKVESGTSTRDQDTLEGWMSHLEQLIIDLPVEG